MHKRAKAISRFLFQFLTELKTVRLQDGWVTRVKAVWKYLLRNRALVWYVFLHPAWCAPVQLRSLLLFSSTALYFFNQNIPSCSYVFFYFCCTLELLCKITRNWTGSNPSSWRVMGWWCLPMRPASATTLYGRLCFNAKTLAPHTRPRSSYVSCFAVCEIEHVARNRTPEHPSQDPAQEYKNKIKESDPHTGTPYTPLRLCGRSKWKRNKNWITSSRCHRCGLPFPGCSPGEGIPWRVHLISFPFLGPFIALPRSDRGESM